MLFVDAAELMILDCQSRQLSPQTILFYRQRARSVDKILGSKRITEVTVNDARLVLAKSSPRSIRHQYVFLSRLFRFLMDDEILTKNPMAKVQPPKVEQKVVDPISPAEILRCFKAAKAGRGFIGVRDSVIFATLVSTGIRREELCNLRDEDVRIEDGALLVHGKGRKQRLVPVPAELKKMLAHYRYARNDVNASQLSTGRFFHSRNGGPLNPAVLTLLIRRLGKDVGIHLHPHRLRHTFATSFMSNDGADILTLQAICGWSQLAMAQRYAKPSMAKMQRSMDSFSPVSQLK